MKRYPSHLILLKGEDRTAEVAKFTYEKGRPFVRVTFRSGGSFRYSASNFAAFKGVETKLLDGKALLLDGNLRLDAYGMQASIHASFLPMGVIGLCITIRCA